MKRTPTLVILVLGALGVGLAAAPSGAGSASALGWAAAAGALLMLMLQGIGLRVLGVLLTLVAITIAGLTIAAGGRALLLLIPAALIGWAGVAASVRGPGWATRLGPGPRAAPADAWTQLDDGLDPTDVVTPEDPR